MILYIIGPQFHGTHTKNCHDYFTVVGISHNLINPIYYYYIVVIYDLLCLKLHTNLGRNLPITFMRIFLQPV